MAVYSLHYCYREIVSASNSRSGPRGQNIDFAAAYAAEGLRLPNASSPAELTAAARTQALYVRNNLSGWRGDTAKLVRSALDAILKGAK